MTFLQLCLSENIVKRSLKVSMIVGTILLAINQGDRIVYGLGVDWLKAILTYMVPYCVSTYSAVCTAMESK
ncbi:MAG: nitrate/nitrite transporter NrtS [Pseudomonadota bacterium]